VKRRLLLLVDGVLLVVAAFLGVRLYEAWSARPPAAPAETAPAASAEAAAPPTAVTPGPPLTAYGTVADRNLFSPTRTETAPEPPKPTTTATPTAPAPKPKLYGVVILGEGRGRAYLEDAQRKRVFAYSVGDLVGDARLEQIKSDRVVLRRGSESFEILLYDPTKPRQPGPPAGVQSPEAGGVARPAPGRFPLPGAGPVPGSGPAPGPPPGVRAPLRPRVVVPPPPATPPGAESPESAEEE
jgi:Type II secretion system protein C